MEKKIIRSFTFDVNANNNEKYGDFIEGRAIVFEKPTNIGLFTEIIDRNALKETDLRDVRFLVNHNTDMIPLARSRRNNENSTMQMVVGEEGMDIRANLDTENNADARALYSATKRGDISGMSFMMTVPEDGEEWDFSDEKNAVRRITKIQRIYEVSACTFPAYENGTSLEARGDEEALENAKSVLEKARAEAEEKAERDADINELTSLLNELEANDDN
jgi:HK97 family phage prohead protease